MQKVIAVSGVKNSGKTSLIEKLVSELTSRGRKVAVIKHDGHDFDCDIPGTDTHRFLIASDLPEETFGERTVDMNDISGISDIIEETGIQK